MSCPNKNPAPLGDSDHPILSSGSDQSKSHIGPTLGISCNRFRFLISSKLFSFGDKPPCKQKILSSTTADKGRKSNKFVIYFHTLKLPNFRRHSSQNPQAFNQNEEKNYLGDRSTLMISPQKCDLIGIFNFETKQQTKTLG